MRRVPNNINRGFLNNLAWFITSLLLAFFIWVLAVTQANPIAERTFRNIPIRLEMDEGLTVVNSPTLIARVNVFAPASVLDALTSDDIIVRADLRGLPTGVEHVVPLTTEVARRAITDTQPTQITVVLEPIVSRQIPVNIHIIGEPPADLRREDPIPEIAQVRVSGAQSRVEQVVAAVGEINLTDVRTSIDEIITLVPVNSEGQQVQDVTLEPQSVNVSVEIVRRDDIREFPVRPNFLFETLPDGYVITSMNYTPETVFVGGNPQILESLQDTLLTEPIDLTGRTESFELSVPIQLPEQGLILFDNQTVTISVEISALTSVKQFDAIPVEVIGVDENVEVRLAPEAVSVIITAPQAQLDALSASDVRVAIDLNGLEAGNYSVEPEATVLQAQVTVDNITVLPANIGVEIILPQTPTPEVTAPPSEASMP